MKSVHAVVHIHSDWSYDGRWSLGRLVSLFAKFGVGALLMSEHTHAFDSDKWKKYKQACEAASTDRTRIVAGLEYSDEQNLIHTMVWGDLPFLGETRPVDGLLRQVRELGGVAVLAHPSRRDAWKEFQPSWLDYVSGVEVWNRKTDGWCPSAETLAWIDLHHASVPHFVGLDFHNVRQLYPLTMELRVEDDVETGALDAMRHRRCEARAWGLAAGRFTSGVLAGTSRAAESLRQTIRQTIQGARFVRGTCSGLDGDAPAHHASDQSRYVR